METRLTKKYNVATAISMVVGIVIGSGVFFKAEKILAVTGGNVVLGIVAWVIGGLIMLICTYAFSGLASRYEYVSGLVDYAEAAMGKTYAYYVGWFMCLVYYPTLAAALSWVSARYVCLLLGLPPDGGGALSITAFFLIASFFVNTLSPILAGKVQVACTVIKLIPLVCMGIFGISIGVYKGILADNLLSPPLQNINPTKGLLSALAATAFAYDGWIVATCINAELHNAKKNLPRALMIGTVIVISVYILYYLGLFGASPKNVLAQGGEQGITTAFTSLFSNIGGSLLFVFVIISCLGSLNGIMMGCARGLYSLAIRGEGPRPSMFSQVDSATNVPVNSAIWGLFVTVCWLLYYYGATLGGWFSGYGFDITELPIITMYGSYIPIFLMIIKKEKTLTTFHRYIVPILAVVSCLFMITAACLSHKQEVIWYLLVFICLMLPAVYYNRRKKKGLNTNKPL
ncbi:MAG: APC family permease [Ruminococcaceae bacterium]|nr:APC family permease [Oscillospiraceae bacterium]